MTDTTPRRQSPPISFRDQSVERNLARRADSRLSAGQVAARDLDRYYDLLRREYDRVTLSDAEWSLLRDVCNGTIWESASIPLLWAQVSDALHLGGNIFGLEAKWGVDGPTLIAKLRALTPGQAVAVIDAIERWRRQRC